MQTRGRKHTTLTETAALVVHELERLPGIKMIAPGEIKADGRTKNGRFLTCVYTTAGFELIVSGQSTQRVAVHTDGDPRAIYNALQTSKRLRGFICKERERKPGIR